MALIRQSAAQTMAREAVVLDLGDLARQGEQIKARARAQADAILAEARAERERLIATAAEEGRAQGLAQGLEEGKRQGEAAGRQGAMEECRAKLGALEKGWTEGLAAFEAERERMLLEARHDVVRLASLVAVLVTKRAVEFKPETVVDQIGAALALLSKPTRLTLAVNPDDEPLVRDALPELCRRYSAAAHVDIAQDPSVGRGGCIARTAGGGIIDATIRTQLERIARTLVPGTDEPGAGPRTAPAPEPERQPPDGAGG